MRTRLEEGRDEIAVSSLAVERRCSATHATLRFNWRARPAPVEQSDEVVRSGDQVASQLTQRQAAKPSSTEATHGLHLAKHLLCSLAEALAHAVAGVACRSTIDGAPPPSRVLRYVWRHAALAQLGDTNWRVS